MIWILYLLTAAFAFAQPKDAFIVERAPIPASIHPNRELVLWMLNPVKHDRGPLEIEPYTCPEWTLGSYYSGQTRISLIDTTTRNEINAVNLRYAYRKEDEFDIPYRILGARYMPYLVPNGSDKVEGKPRLLALRDFNGDGLALETGFYEAEACMGLQTTLLGYSVKQDRVIQYQTQLRTQDIDIVKNKGYVNKGLPKIEKYTWIDYLFSEQPRTPGHWSYEIDYRGRLGTLDKYEVHYDRAREMFLGTLKRIGPPPDR